MLKVGPGFGRTAATPAPTLTGVKKVGVSRDAGWALHHGRLRVP
jgi:hypothetical protein